MAKPKHVRALKKALEIAGGYRPLNRITGITHSTLRNLEKVRPVMETKYAIGIEEGFARTPGVEKIDRLEFYPELLRGPLGKRLVKAAQESEKDPELWSDLIRAKLTV